MRIELNPYSLQHSITPEEIRMVVEAPSVRYRVDSPTRLDADLVRSIGRAENEPWIEVVAEEFEGGTVQHVFHAMLMRPAVASEAYLASGGAFNEHQNIPQRAFVGPQFTHETAPSEPARKENEHE
ncbi:MAG: hypothetical protein KDB67_09765 [Gordonia sp.]|uniref:hypothetical protein n=1 Tax=Gordonia sp. (in: high G+C Gram-positive bacteria) TaxID=84139 RepID=UPI001D6270B0|nr:hypothetical protein [Gordonia sp. (in: high G+C Gram-positive bacteria)]MCB1294952.1 hypothetical protein [Gordonia sp. (in: high G+C Gram-positive bacteria)]HQV16750.1 hypothetical protein [Gordonia sp. (in: high G+C Gram-positive bacteria)]